MAAERAAQALLVGVLSLALASVASAQPRRNETKAYVVTVAASAELEAVAARVSVAARRGLGGMEQVAWLPADLSYQSYDADALGHLRTARELLSGGRDAYLNLDLPAAIERLTRALAEFDQAAAALDDPTEVSEALMFLGAAQEFEGQAREARQTFTRLHTQMPSRAPDPDTYPPEVIARYEQSAPRDHASPSGAIQVESDPPGAIVFVDYSPRGRTPITVDDLIAGEHVVRVVRPGATPYVQTIEVRRGAPYRISAVLVDTPESGNLGVGAETLTAETAGSMAAGSPLDVIGESLDLALVGAIVVSNGTQQGTVDVRLEVYQRATRRRVSHGQITVELTPGSVEQSVPELVQRVFGAALRSRPRLATGGRPTSDGDGEEGGEAPEAEAPDSDDGGLTDQWWFWTGIGAVAVIGVVVVVVVATSDGGNTTGNDSSGQIVLEF